MPSLEKSGGTNITFLRYWVHRLVRIISLMLSASIASISTLTKLQHHKHHEEVQQWLFPTSFAFKDKIDLLDRAGMGRASGCRIALNVGNVQERTCLPIERMASQWREQQGVGDGLG